MRTTEAIKHFGSRAELAKALGIEAPSIYSWGREPPPLRQLQIERMTGGALKARTGILPTNGGVTEAAV